LRRIDGFQARNPQLPRNKRALHAVGVLIWGINTPFLLDAGLTIFEVGDRLLLGDRAGVPFGAIAGGVLQPVRQTYLHLSIPTSERATLVSFDSLVGSLGCVGGQAGLGYLSQERSVPVGFVVGGLATALVLPIFGKLRALKQPADRITTEAPERAATPPATVGAEADHVAPERSRT
jgi:hypothetical protein